MGLLIFICGIAATLIGILGYVIRPVRKLDEILPDHDAFPVSGKKAFQNQPGTMKKTKKESVFRQGT
jgi:hypothetical protein